MSTELDTLREQAREQSEEIERLKAALAGKANGAVMVVTPEEWNALQEQVRTLEADNAAKDTAFREYVEKWGVEHDDVPGTDASCPEDDTCECQHIRSLNAAFGPPHPGAALLSEMEALRQQVRTLTADNAALLTELRDSTMRVDKYDDARCWCEFPRDFETERHDTYCLSMRETTTAPHPGAALLAEMERLREQVRILTEERDDVADVAEQLRNTVRAREAGELAALAERDEARARVAELEADSDYLRARREEANAAHILLDRAGESPAQSNIAERVRALLAKRETLVSERDAFRARVEEEKAARETAEHERGELRAGLAEALNERDDAVAKAAIWERAASLAREEALEEAAQSVERADDGVPLQMLADDGIRALKAQPGRRFVGAEEVRKVLRDLRDSYPGWGEHESVEDAAKRLGLTLDGEAKP